MKTEINLQELIQNLNLDYPEIIQISDDINGRVRLIGYVSDLPIYREKRWYVTAELITVDSLDNSILKLETAKVKNRDWLISNDYLAIVTLNQIPVINESFQTKKDIEVGIDENENLIYESVDAEITLENSPYQLMPAFDFYFGIRHSKTTQLKMSDLFQSAVESHDKWGYFDKKESHIELIDVIKLIYQTPAES